ncbi:MAG: hypothetical protein R2880_09710 [Deinococcales bacterium]
MMRCLMLLSVAGLFRAVKFTQKNALFINRGDGSFRLGECSWYG